MTEAVRAFIRSQGIGAAVGNILLNPAFVWLGNGELVFTPLTFILFSLLGAARLPFVGFALFKAVWTPLVAIVVVRWAVLRQLAPVPAT
ncbi:MAG: hypothetical protein ACLQPD_14225 [Desulfomonilaceae bacterium]